jgi:1-deoxy-D-xylulose-5-phosphate reductoisomerase
MKKVGILGSTGSIGVQSLDIIRARPDLFKAQTLAAGGNVDALEAQCREFKPRLVSCANDVVAKELKERLRDMESSPEILYGEQGLEAATVEESIDLVVMGLPGSVGLKPSFAAVEAGKDIALATKETLVMAGGLFMDLVAEKGVKLTPVDSEQSAIFQCLEGNRDKTVRRMLLTASGGPFRTWSKDEIQKAHKAQVLDHPRWKMGPKVTVDSATLMNKGLEVIEARWLFDIEPSRIEVVIHPQSIIHSMVEFEDTSIIAQLSDTDMRAAIAYGMSYPERIDGPVTPLNFPEIASLTFESPDFDRFPLLGAAYHSLESDETVAPIVLNAADEVAVGLFLEGRIRFRDIPVIALKAMERIPSATISTLQDVIDLHNETCSRVMSDLA